MCGATRKLQCIPIMCLRGPCVVMMYNIHVSCNLLCAMCVLPMHGAATCVTAMQETHLGETHLGKHLIMPYCKNTTKQLFS